jgi:hypothetical protein
MTAVGPRVPCRLCGADIRFLTTARGKPMPVQAQPCETWLLRGGRGPQLVLVGFDGVTYRGVAVAEPLRGELTRFHKLVQGHEPHFGHCPVYLARHRAPGGRP